MAIWISAILLVFAVALFVAAPLSEGLLRKAADSHDLALERLEHERGLAVQALRELDFDYQMKKIDQADYEKLRNALEARAINAMSGIETARAKARPQLRLASSRTKPAGVARVNYCPQCGFQVGSNHRFCAGCGAALDVAPGAAKQAE